MLHTWGEGGFWKENLHWNIRLNEAHWGSGTVKKQPCDPLFMVLHEAHISFGQAENWGARQRDREIKRGKGGEEGESLCLCTPRSAPALYFCFLFLCTLSAHTHSAMDFQLGPHQLCAWWNKHWQPLYICKGPCSSCACPTHTMRAHKHALTHTHTTHTQPLNQGPSPSWGLHEEPTLHKMALASRGCTLPCSPATLAYTHSQTHSHTQCVSCFVRQNNTAAH